MAKSLMIGKLPVADCLLILPMQTNDLLIAHC